MADRSERLASLEFIQVDPSHFNDYRKVMRDYCGPAAAKLVRADKFGTFRAMETAAVLYRDPGLTIDWNQIHLCELNPDGFHGFGPEFRATLREDASDVGDAQDVFAGQARMRTVPRWTLNDAVIEADAAVGQEGRNEACGAKRKTKPCRVEVALGATRLGLRHGYGRPLQGDEFNAADVASGSIVPVSDVRKLPLAGRK